MKELKIVAIFLVVLLAACGKSEDSQYQPSLGEGQQGGVTEYVVGVHPLHNPQRLMELYGPLVEYINRNIPKVHFTLEASRNYEEFEKKLYAGKFAFAMPNPYQSVMAQKHGYRIFGKMGGDEDFRGIILVLKGGKINRLSDLKGKSVAYPAPTALAATLLPQYYLHTNGIDINRDIKNVYVGSQESSIMNVLNGDVAAGATWPLPWKKFAKEQPELAQKLEVKWQTDTLPNNAWVVRQDIPPELAERFGRLLFGMNDSDEGRSLLSALPVSRFEAATDETYQPVRTFLDTFSRTVRSIEH